MGLYTEYEGKFKIGAAVNTRSIVTAGGLITENFNSLTAENEMKPASLHPAEGTWNFAGADRIADFARKNSLVMRGHTLVWHNQTGDWFYGGSREDIKARLSEHMRTVIDRYKDVTWCWDVVNEAVSDRDGGDILRESKWRGCFGEDYVENAFITAHEAAQETGAKLALVYNDYNTVIPSKRERILRLIERLRRAKAPVDALGMQGHWNIGFPNAAEIRKTIEAARDIGLRVHITELDVSIYPENGSPERKFADTESFLKSDAGKAQLAKFEEIFAIFSEYSSVIDCVVTWGVADDMTWLDGFPVRNRKNYPLLFGIDHRRKL